MAKRAEAINPGNSLLDQILDEALSHEPTPIPNGEQHLEKLRKWQAYGSKKAKEAGLGLKDVTAVVRATVRNTGVKNTGK